MARPRQKFIVRQVVIDDFGSESIVATHETWAVSARQAENQVRHREGYPARVTDYGNKAIIFRAV